MRTTRDDVSKRKGRERKDSLSFFFVQEHLNVPVVVVVVVVAGKLGDNYLSSTICSF